MTTLESKITMELIPRQSFYGKATTEQDGNTLKLYSYNTLAAEIVSRETSKEYIYMGKYSQTTSKGIFKQNGLTDKRINGRRTFGGVL